MELDFIIQHVKKSNRKKLITGAFIAAFGLFLLLLHFISDSATTGMSDSGIGVLYFFALLFTVVGVLMLGLAIKNNGQIKNRTHPILMAIDNPVGLSVIWVYEHILKTSGGVTTHTLHIYFSNGKGEQIMTKKTNIKPAMEFFYKHFPNARYGFSEDFKKEMSQQQKKLKKGEIDRIAF